MKPGYKGYANVSLWLGLALLCTLPILYFVLNHEGPSEDMARHLTQGEIATVETRDFTPPPIALSMASLTHAWEAASFPYTPHREFISREATDKNGRLLTVEQWYRFPATHLASLKAPYYLYIPRWKSDGTIAVYAANQLVYQSHSNLKWNGSNVPLWIPIGSVLNEADSTDIIIRIQHLHGIGGALSSVWLGNFDALYWRYSARMALQAHIPHFSSAAFLAAGIFSLFVWFRRRDDRLYLLFGLISIAGWLRTLHHYVGSERMPISDEWFGWITLNSLFWMLYIGHVAIETLHKRPAPWLTKPMLVASVLSSLISIPLISGALDPSLAAPWIYVAAVFFGISTSIVNCVSSLRTRSWPAGLLSGWSLFSCLVLGVHDWLLQNNRIDIESMFFGAYSNVGIFYIFAFILYRRYVTAIHEVEKSNIVLGQRLKEREAELKASYERLRTIEHHETLRLERQRLMQDMHDGLGSSLVSALHVVEHGKVGESDIAQVLKDCIDDLKLTIDSMEPVEADLLLLLATLRFRLAPRLAASGITLRWEITDVPPLNWLTPRHSLHILRILQEAFTNVIKHAHASEIRVTTTADEQHVTVSITDDGKGFSLEAAAQKGGSKGLKNQRQRAETIQATVAWATGANGTCFSLRLPIALEKQAATTKA